MIRHYKPCFVSDIFKASWDKLDFVSVEKLWISSNRKNRASTFALKFTGPFKMLKFVKNNAMIDTEGGKTKINLDQFRFYKFCNDSIYFQMFIGESQRLRFGKFFYPFRQNIYIIILIAPMKLPVEEFAS